MSENQKVKEAVDEMMYIRQTSHDRRGHYKGEELGEMKCKEVPQFPGVTNMNELYAVLRKCWRANTAYPDCQKDWEASDPSYGQCAITAALVNDMFGGSIHRISLKGGGTHYFNKIEGKWVDLTFEQFSLYRDNYNETPNRTIPRERTCQTGSARSRYVKLQQNMMVYLNQK